MVRFLKLLPFPQTLCTSPHESLQGVWYRLVSGWDSVQLICMFYENSAKRNLSLCAFPSAVDVNELQANFQAISTTDFLFKWSKCE